MQTLKSYEETSGKMINCDKIHFMVFQNLFDSTKDRIKRITSFKHIQDIITYLGFPLFMGKPIISYFSNLLK